ncbi:MAG: DUF4426 domain-containing protein [Gammaproteobacteria bacterium]|jgi:hypothetical protein|nr:DUF4426 domain-containing protein [Gammaproteobacteria bacterium]
MVVACGQKATPPAATVPTPSEPATSSSKDFGDYVLYFNAIRTDSLTPEIATSYGIVRSANRALVNLSMVKKAEGSPGIPVPGSVTVQAVNLNGQFKDLALREVREGQAIYYIGDVGVAGDETLVFTVEATPENTTTPFAVKFQRQFPGE